MHYLLCGAAFFDLSPHCLPTLGYRLVIICSNEQEEKSHFISKLYHFRRPYMPGIDKNDYRKYLYLHFTNRTQDFDFQADSCMAASSVDFEQ